MPHDSESDEVRPAASPPRPAGSTRPRPPGPAATPQPPPPDRGAADLRRSARRAEAVPAAADGERPAAERPQGPRPTPAAAAARAPSARPRSGEASTPGPPTAELRPYGDPAQARAPHGRRRRLPRARRRPDRRRRRGYDLADRRPDARRRPQESYEGHGRCGTAGPWTTSSPQTLEGMGAGPGGADRHWIRVAVAPDSNCRGAFDPLLSKALSPVGCSRLLRATYADETTQQRHHRRPGLHTLRRRGHGHAAQALRRGEPQ